MAGTGALKALKLSGAAIVGAAAIAGCGSSGTHFANTGRPPVPINLTVYVNASRVSISPSSIGAGPVTFLVTNATGGSRTVDIRSLLTGRTIGTTGSIDGGQPAQLQLDLKSGDFHIDAGGATTPATLRVGRSRPSANNVLLQP